MKGKGTISWCVLEKCVKDNYYAWIHKFNNILLHDNIAMGLGHKCSPH